MSEWVSMVHVSSEKPSKLMRKMDTVWVKYGVTSFLFPLFQTPGLSPLTSLQGTTLTNHSLSPFLFPAHDICFQGGNYIVCWNVGRTSTFDAAKTWKPFIGKLWQKGEKKNQFWDWSIDLSLNWFLFIITSCLFLKNISLYHMIVRWLHCLVLPVKLFLIQWICDVHKISLAFT